MFDLKPDLLKMLGKQVQLLIKFVEADEIESEPKLVDVRGLTVFLRSGVNKRCSRSRIIISG